MGRGGLSHPFFFEILYYFYRILRKIKSIYIAGQVSRPPLSEFSDPRLKATGERASELRSLNMSAKVGVLFISYKLILVRCTISVAITLRLCLSMRSLPVVDPHYAAYLFAVLYSYRWYRCRRPDLRGWIWKERGKEKLRSAKT